MLGEPLSHDATLALLVPTKITQGTPHTGAAPLVAGGAVKPAK